MQPKPQALQLERTGQFLAVPISGPPERDGRIQPAVDRCVAQLAVICGH